MHQSFFLAGPPVTGGAIVTTVEYGGTYNASRNYEADFVNSTAAPLDMDLGVVNPDWWFVIGAENSCGIGSDSCHNGCVDWEGIQVVPPNSTCTKAWSAVIGPYTATATSGFYWPCIIGRSAVAGFLFGHFTNDAGEVRWTSSVEATLHRRVELSLSPNFSCVCTGGVANSTGASATLEWYGSSEAETQTAVVLATDRPVDAVAACVVSGMHDPAPPGLGTVPVTCAQGQRYD